MGDLALTVYASETGRHLTAPPEKDARWQRFLRAFDARAYEARLAAAGYRFLADLPPLLGAIHDPPPGLFVRGDPERELLTRPAVAIVGARSCSGYGATVARSLGRELAAAGLVIVSGLARGVDGEAHRGALEEGREVFAVPGEITSSLSAGTNGLLRLGAAPLTSAADVLHAFGIDPADRDDQRSPLLGLLPASADELVRRTGLGADEVARALVELELVGSVAVHEGVYRSTS